VKRKQGFVGNNVADLSRMGWVCAIWETTSNKLNGSSRCSGVGAHEESQPRDRRSAVVDVIHRQQSRRDGGFEMRIFGRDDGPVYMISSGEGRLCTILGLQKQKGLSHLLLETDFLDVGEIGKRKEEPMADRFEWRRCDTLFCCLEWFLWNFLCAKLDGRSTTHAQPTNLKNCSRNFPGPGFFSSGGEETALSILKETKLCLPWTANQETPSAHFKELQLY